MSEIFSNNKFDKGIILNVNKPKGWTSFEVVKYVRSALKIQKVGHAGTLDPFATGVLLVCTGKSTKNISKLMDYEKEYHAEFELGKQTDTHDIEGTFVGYSERWKDLKESEIINTIMKYRGVLQQIPPMYSALKVKGKRLYNYARLGIIIRREPREIKINSIKVHKISLPFISIIISCSKGTYIRALVRDIGNELNTCAYLRCLTRLKIGNYRLENAMSVENLVRQYS